MGSLVTFVTQSSTFITVFVPKETYKILTSISPIKSEQFIFSTV